MDLIRVRRTAVLAATVAAAACTDPAGPAPPLTDLPRPLSVAEQKVAASSNQFAFDLFREVNAEQRDSNVFISPLSATMALGMTLNGASAETWNEMRDALRLAGATQQEVNEGYRDLIALLRGLDPATELRIANSVWYRQGFPFHTSFLNESAQYFDAEVSGLDFTNQAAALAAINGWVNSATSKRIPTIIEEITDEVMFLVNAIYFKGTWEKQFDPRSTNNAPFFALDGTTATIPLMHQTGDLRTANSQHYQAVDLRYGNSAFTMTVILPNPGRDVNTLVESLEPGSWQSLVDSFSERRADLYLPRFKLEWERVLNSPLIRLGMGRAFTPFQAQFERMSPKGNDLFISKVKQKTFVEVNEEGTEAAAATSVGVMPVSAPPTIRVDRPFILLIRERFSGTILFIGKIARLPA